MPNKILDLYHHLNKLLAKFEYFILIVLMVGLVTLSFSLAYKRYYNFEYGKFDLGNMSQVVWNISRGDFYQITDQFGSNMSRIGMSHFDPILLIFTPFYWIFAHPLVLVFFQHLLIASAVIPLYLLTKKLLQSELLSITVCLTYLLFPALGFTLVWTEFHGISFVAPLFLWLVWFLEKYNFKFVLNKKNIAIYFVLLILLLSGKEEISAIIGVYSIIIMSRNFKLGLITMLISFSWFITVFFFIIPAYSHVRRDSIDKYLNYIGENNPVPEDAQGDNFFYQRYSYLGEDYPEMLKNLVTRPNLVKSVVLTDEKTETFFYLFGPLAFVPLLNFNTYVSMPDFMITVLSEEEIFSISNHRITFIIFTTFLGYIYFLAFVAKKLPKVRYFVHLLVIVNFFLCIYFSLITRNPLTFPIFSKLPIGQYISDVYAQNNTTTPLAGDIVRNKTVDNTFECKQLVTNLVNSSKLEVYTGPDYLGAHTSLRKYNAVFPSAGWNADLIVADYYEDKTYDPLDNVDSWTINKKVLLKILVERDMKHVLSCDRMMVFSGNGNTDTVEYFESGSPDDVYQLQMKDKKIGIAIKILESPNSSNNFKVTYALQRMPGAYVRDKVTFWNFIDENGKTLEFIDYVPVSLTDKLPESKDDAYLLIKRDFEFVRDQLSDNVQVYYGMSNQIDGAAIYLGEWTL